MPRRLRDSPWKQRRRESQITCAPQVSRPAAGIDDGSMEDAPPPSLPLGHRIDLVPAYMPRRARTLTAVVPIVESRRRRAPRLEPRHRVDEVGVVAVVAAEVLPPQA
jgi:hypothetical protein